MNSRMRQAQVDPDHELRVICSPGRVRFDATTIAITWRSHMCSRVPISADVGHV